MGVGRNYRTPPATSLTYSYIITLTLLVRFYRKVRFVVLATGCVYDQMDRGEWSSKDRVINTIINHFLFQNILKIVRNPETLIVIPTEFN